MDIVLYYAPITCALAPYVTLTEAERAVRGARAQFPQGPAQFAGVSEAQSQAQGAAALGRRQVADREHRDPDLDRAHLPAGEAAAVRPVAGAEGDLADVVVLVGHPSVPGAHQQAAAGLRRAGAGTACKKLAAAMLFENYQDRRRHARGPRVLLRPLHGARRAFLLVLAPRHAVRLDVSGFPNCAAHFERIKSGPSVQKLLAWEKSVKEEFAKAA